MPEQPGSSSRDWSFLLGRQQLQVAQPPQAPVADQHPQPSVEDRPSPVVRSSPDLYCVYAWHTKPVGGPDDLMAIFPNELEAEQFVHQIRKSITAYRIVRINGTSYETLQEVG